MLTRDKLTKALKQANETAKSALALGCTTDRGLKKRMRSKLRRSGHTRVLLSKNVAIAAPACPRRLEFDRPANDSTRFRKPAHVCVDNWDIAR